MAESSSCVLLSESRDARSPEGVELYLPDEVRLELERDGGERSSMRLELRNHLARRIFVDVRRVGQDKLVIELEET